MVESHIPLTIALLPRLFDSFAPWRIDPDILWRISYS